MREDDDEFDVPSEVHPHSPRSGCWTPEQPHSPLDSPRLSPWTPLCDAHSPVKPGLDNPSLESPVGANQASRESLRRYATCEYDESKDASTGPRKACAAGPWDKFQRFTAGIAGIVPGRRNSGDVKGDVHGAAVELLKLAFAVCTSTPADCLRFASAATALDRLALKRVLELAVLSGLLGPSTESFFDHIEAFLRGTNAKVSKSHTSISSETCSDRKELFKQKGRSFTSLSETSNLSAPSKDTEFSASSYADFNGKHKSQLSFFDYMLSRSNSSSQMPVVMEIDMPKLPITNSPKERSHTSLSEETPSEGGASYHSMCDVVLVRDNGSKREPVRAEVYSLGNKGDGSSQMRIAFKSDCLKTQNEWQRHLLLQQRSLVDAMTTKLENKEEELQMQNEVMAEEKELLRSFRKIVTREIDLTQKSLTVEVFVVEKDAELSREIEELCEILEFPCSTFRSLTLAMEGMKNSSNIVLEYQRRHLLRSTTVKSNLGTLEQPPNKQEQKGKTLRHMETRDILALVGETGSSDIGVRNWMPSLSLIGETGSQATPATPSPYRRSGTSKSNMSSLPDKLWRSEGASDRSLNRSATSKSSLSRLTENTSLSHYSSSLLSGISADPMYCRIVFVGSEWLQRDLPPEWLEGDAAMYIVLTSKPEKYEEVGRQLLAENKAEMLERLSTRGISDYVLQPLTLDGLRRLANAAMCKSFGHEYLLTNVLGRGAYGVVYRAKRLKDGKLFALKEINTKRMTKSAQADLEIEAELLKHLRWPTVVDMVDAWYVATLRYLLMPLLDRGTIDNRIRVCKENSQHIPLASILDWYGQILHGLVYLHHSGVIHRDIKPSNLLLAVEGVLQIGDLGNAVRVPGFGPHPCKRIFVVGTGCTPCYTSPESNTLNVILFASDLWSVGVSLYEILTLQSLFPAKVAPPELREMIDKLDLESSSFFRDPKNVGSIALATLRNSPHGSDNSSVFVEVSADLKQLLRHDPLQRPGAASLAARENIRQTLRNVLTRNLAEPEEHFAIHEILIAESKEAEKISPPSLDCTYPPADGGRFNKRRSTKNTLISALTKRDLQ